MAYINDLFNLLNDLAISKCGNEALSTYKSWV